MENIIRNIQVGDGDNNSSGLEYALKCARENEWKTGNKTYVNRIVDIPDTYSKDHQTWLRSRYSFDVYEII